MAIPTKESSNQMKAQEYIEKFSNLSSALAIITMENATIFLIGTNHANQRCQEDVSYVIRSVHPKSVVLELCASRICGCPEHRNSVFQKKPEFSYEYLKNVMKEIGTVAGLIFFADVYKERQIAEGNHQIYLDYGPKSGIRMDDGNIFLEYGGEMIRGILEAKMQKDCTVMLGDRPIHITLKRQASALSYWKRVHLITQVSLAVKFQKWKDWLLLNASKLVFQDERAFNVLVTERDLYLAISMKLAATTKNVYSESKNIVAIVGQGHIPGILRYWTNVTPDMLPLLLSPEFDENAKIPAYY